MVGCGHYISSLRYVHLSFGDERTIVMIPSPSAEWFSDLGDIMRAYRAARSEGRYECSDALRETLISAGVIDIDTNPRWHPVFESPESRSARFNGELKVHDPT